MKPSTDTRDSGRLHGQSFLSASLIRSLNRKQFTIKLQDCWLLWPWVHSYLIIEEAITNSVLELPCNEVCVSVFCFFSTLTRNIRHRRGEKVVINVPSKLEWNEKCDQFYKLVIVVYVTGDMSFFLICYSFKHLSQLIFFIHCCRSGKSLVYL